MRPWWRAITNPIPAVCNMAIPWTSIRASLVFSMSSSNRGDLIATPEYPERTALLLVDALAPILADTALYQAAGC